MVDVVDTTVAMANSSTYAGALGVKILTNFAVTLKKCTKDAACTATRCRLYEGDGTTLIETGSVSGDDATFTSSLLNATNYRIVWDNSGANYTRKYSGAVLPKVGTNVNFPTGNDDSLYCYNVASVTTEVPIAASGGLNAAERGALRCRFG